MGSEVVGSDLQFYRKLLLVANTLTVLEPVDAAGLSEELGSAVSEKELRRILRYLRDRRLIRPVGDRRYVSTLKGLAMASGTGLGKRRDIERMFHLLGSQ